LGRFDLNGCCSSGVTRLGVAGLFLGLSAYGIFPGDTNFTAPPISLFERNDGIDRASD